MYIFHGGCLDCTQQADKPISFCAGCQYFDGNWSLPDLSNKPKSDTDIMRDHIKNSIFIKKKLGV